MSEIDVNPFAVPTPENLTAEEIYSLFVPYPEFENLQVGGHQFLHGHRGSGKSMMLRMMSPDSQILWRSSAQFQGLPYFGVYLSIKMTELSNPEYRRLEDEVSGSVLSEHILTIKLLSAFFKSIEAYCFKNIQEEALEIKLIEVITSTVFNKLRSAGWNAPVEESIALELSDTRQALAYLLKLVDEIYSDSVGYIKRRSFSPQMQTYQGPLLGFQDVLLPIVKAMSESGRPCK